MNATAAAIANAFLAGEWNEKALIRRARAALALTDRPGAVRRKATVASMTPWLAPLVQVILALYPEPPLDRRRELADYVASNRGLQRTTPLLQVRRWHTPGSAMGKASWPVRPLRDAGALKAWLNLDEGELGWFADVQSRERAASQKQLRHYVIGIRQQPAGGVRILESPKARLKSLQRLILRDILNEIPVHSAAHGFVRGRSVVSAAAPHQQQPAVVLLDLEGFFASITAGRVFGVLHSAGYSEDVAHLLTGLCTTVLPRKAWHAIAPPENPALQGKHWRLGRDLAAPHLPQGAPTSPALANLVAFALDRRLATLAGSWGVTYTRYADDLAFSGRPLRSARAVQALTQTATEIVCDEAFRLNAAKSRTLKVAQRQQFLGIVVNEHPAVSRDYIDRLRATLHNCKTQGVESQRRGRPDLEQHLRGRISWVAQVQPARAARLLEAFNQLSWD